MMLSLPSTHTPCHFWAFFCFINLSEITLAWRENIRYVIAIVAYLTNFHVCCRFLHVKIPPPNVSWGPERQERQGSCKEAAASHTRSQCQMEKNLLPPPQPEMKVNVWEIKPPDFSYKLYKSMRCPEKPSRTMKEEQKRKKSNFQETVHHLPSIRKHPEKAAPPKFITTFPHVDSHKANLMFVKSGKYPNGVYFNPKPHDFRQVHRSIWF